MPTPYEPLRDHDLHLLSSYLDDELESRARASLERRLAEEPPLAAALADLRANHALLRSLPLLKAPRSFTLDPARYARGLPWWQRLLGLENVLQLGGALGAAASIILIALGVVIGMRADGQQHESAGVALRPSPTVWLTQDTDDDDASEATPAGTTPNPISATLAAPAPAFEAGADSTQAMMDDAHVAPSGALDAAPAAEALREMPPSPPALPEEAQAFSAAAPGAAEPEAALQSEGEAAASGAAQPAAPLGAAAPSTSTRTPPPTASSTPSATRTGSPAASDLAQAPKLPDESPPSGLRGGTEQGDESGTAGTWLAALGLVALAASLGVWWVGRRVQHP